MSPSDSGWTVSTLKEHFDSKFKAVDDRFRDAGIAVNKAEEAIRAKFVDSNEFRQQLGDQTRTFIPRLEYEAKMSAIEQRLNALERAGTERRGQAAGVKEGWGFIVGAAGLIAAALTILATYVSRKP